MSEQTGEREGNEYSIVTRTQFILALTHKHKHIEYHSNCIECRKLLQALLHTFTVHSNTRYSQCRWFNEFSRDDMVLRFLLQLEFFLCCVSVTELLLWYISVIAIASFVVCRGESTSYLSGIDGKGQRTPALFAFLNSHISKASALKCGSKKDRRRLIASHSYISNYCSAPKWTWLALFCC